MHKKKWNEEEVEVCEAVPEPIAEEVAVPQREQEVENEKKEPDVLVTSFVTKLAHRSAMQFQILESTVEGTEYVVVPLMYFNMKPEEIVMLDDCALIPIIKQ